MSNSEYRNNKNFKKLRSYFNSVLRRTIDRHELYEILEGNYSKSQIIGWLHSESSTRSATGNSRDTFKGQLKRIRPMPDEAFDLFVNNIVDWVDAQLAQEEEG